MISSISQFSNFVYEQHLEIFNKNLQDELLKMVEKEQSLRHQWINASDPSYKEDLKNQIAQIDRLHLNRLKEIIKDHGWPGHSLIGIEGSHAFWLLVQHTPDQLFQDKCLDFLEQAVIKQEASSIDLAYLKDRVYMHAGKKQIYGTQINEDLSFYPIEDEEHVNERRLSIGLSSIEEYLKLVKEMYKEDF